mmetsp:Transcript_39622/g.62658  ORF Transcript_39622/g.62658 Transcript_39622/m.62658 type:complete len:227 (-) Transcript_39622:19-699(-)
MLTFSLASDTSLGKVDKSSLSQQTLMELFIDKIENKDRICDDPESPSPISQWKGTDFGPQGVIDWHVRCNDADEVISIKLWNIRLRGSIQLEWIPLTTQKCVISYNYLSGTISLEHLSDGLVTLYARCNAFSGTVCLTRLPHSLQKLAISDNQLEGTVDLTHLPSGMKKLLLGDNGFSGMTDFSKLPRSLEVLDVSSTVIQGEITVWEGLKVHAKLCDVTVKNMAD